MTNAWLFIALIMISKCPLVPRKVLNASLVTNPSEFLRHLQPPARSPPSGFGNLSVERYFSTGFAKVGLLFLLSFYFFVSKRLLINNRSEGRRKEITAMFLVLVPAGLGGCYFRLNQLPAGSLDEIPPHRDQKEVAPLGDFHQWPVAWDPNCSQAPRGFTLHQDGGQLLEGTALLAKRHRSLALQGEVQCTSSESNYIQVVRIKHPP